MKKRQNAFALIELVMVISITVLLCGILIPAMGHAKRSAFNVVSLNNLNALNAGSGIYAADNKDRVFSYTWRAGVSYKIPGVGVKQASDDAGAAGFQNMDILVRSTGRASGSNRILRLRGSLPHRRSSHLVLLDFLSDVLPEPIAASPFDSNLLKWQSEPLGYRNLSSSGLPYANGFVEGHDQSSSWLRAETLQRWTFSSSYQVVPAAWNGDGIDGENVYVPVSTTPNLFTFRSTSGGAPALGNRLYNQVAFPSNKVHMYEEFDRFTDRSGLYFAYPEANPNVAFFDGSVRAESTADSNPGWNPATPDREWRQRYIPLDTFPLPREGLGSLNRVEYCQRFRWTRFGLQGIDFGGMDVGRKKYGLPQEVIGGCAVD